MTELERLTERLRTARNFNVWWGPDAASLSVEERAALLNRILDDREAGRLQPVDIHRELDAPKVDVRDWIRQIR